MSRNNRHIYAVLNGASREVVLDTLKSKRSIVAEFGKTEGGVTLIKTPGDDRPALTITKLNAIGVSSGFTSGDAKRYQLLRTRYTHG